MARLVHLHARTSRRLGAPGGHDTIVLGEGWHGRPLPAPGSLVFIEFPRAAAGQEAALVYTVVDIDLHGNLTAEAVVGAPPAVHAETPCLVRYGGGLEDQTIEALALTSSGGSVIARLNTADARRYPRSREEVPVTVELPGTSLPVAVGVTEDVSLGGLRARLPVPVPAARHVFVALHPDGTPPIVAVARVVSCDTARSGVGYVARVEYTLMPAIDQARLWSLVESPTGDREP
jgi:hypothetical protein